MFNLIEPGHVLRFGTDPSTIVSPPATIHRDQDNTLATAWPAASHLGLVQCISHPSGPIGSIAADVAKNLRTTPGSISRSASYSGAGRLLTSSNRNVGSVNCDFVGYVDGQSNYIQSTQATFSKDFSGCLMVVYTVAGQRHVAHAAASLVPDMNCKQPFLTTIQAIPAVLNGWFRPYVDALDGNQKIHNYGHVAKYLGGNPNKLTTFGVVTAANQPYAVEAFKPNGIPGNDWVVTSITPKVMSQSWVAP